jgi:hypothetical protein
MRKSIAVKQKKRGRPATGFDPLVGVRFPTELTKSVDAWAGRNGLTRSEAIRRFVEEALAGMQGSKQRSPKARSRALDLASEQVNKLSDPAAPAEEREQRKRRLLKGPKEFREMRDVVRSKRKS